MTDVNTNGPAWSVPVDVEDVADTGLHMELEAPAEICAALARAAGLRELKQLKATFDLTRHAARVEVAGRVSATIGQTCVVTLEPVDNEIDEAVDLVFAPMSAGATATPRSGGQRKGGDEPPEPLVDGVIDLGAVATEFLILGIDPYPRKPGAQFVPPQVADEGPRPFAALEALKKRPGTRKS